MADWLYSLLFLSQPNTAVQITLDELRKHLRLYDDESEDELLQVYLDAAISWIDGPQGWLGRSILPQQIELRLNGFGCRPIALPYPPATDVQSVEFYDGSTWQTIDPANYQLDESLLFPVGSYTWPSTNGLGGAKITYTAGYDPMPPAVKAAVLLMVGYLYENREANADETLKNGPAIALLQPYRQYFV